MYISWCDCAPSGTLANVKSMWDITRLMSRNVTSDLHLGVRRPQRLVDFKDLKSFLFMPLSSSLLPHPAQLAPGRKHQQEENPQPVHNKQRIWASRLWGWFLMGDQIVREFKTFFQEEEKSLRTLAAKISLPMWSTQSDCGGDQHERISLKYFLQMSEMRSDEIVIGFHFQTTNLLYDQLHSPRYPDQCQYLKTTNKYPRMIPGDL